MPKNQIDPESAPDASSMHQQPQLTPAQLIELVSRTVAATMASTNKDSSLSDAVVAAITAVSPKRRGPYKCRSGYNPTGRKRELSRPVFVNGHRVNVKQLFDGELALLEQLKPGRYLEGLITVTEIARAGMTADLHVRYANKTPDQRTILSERLGGGGFLALIKTCIRDHGEQQAAARASLRAQLAEADAAQEQK